ncbi:MAG: peptide/nickel transport system permease protein [Thermomicrobiales bacterium]|nr:peptide/nickel transport system permease protein [Thermomicrobiales bacterium]
MNAAVLSRETLPPRSRRLGLRLLRLDPVLALAIVVIGVTFACAVAPEVLAPYPPNKLAVGPNLAGPSWDHWVGTDEFGRDLLSRLIDGARVELVIGVAGVALAVVLGVPLGVLAGARGGLADTVLMRLQDALLAFPSVLFAILVVAALGASQRSIILTIGVIYLPRFARLVRGSVLVLKEQEFVVASRAAGATDARLMTRHILPNCLAPILVQISLAISVAILIEAGLSYLGLGVQPPTATWGNMLKAAQSYPSVAPWYVLAPGVCIFALVLALNTLGDGLRDRLDPRLRGL